MSRVVHVIDTLYDEIMRFTLALVRVLGILFERDTDVVIESQIVFPKIENDNNVDTHPTRNTFRSIEDVITEKASMTAEIPAGHETVYIETVRAPLFKNPTREFDGIIRICEYGHAVTVLGEQGKFLHVRSNGHEGWMLRDDVTTSAEDVYPVFVPGEVNDIDDPNTIRVRAIIQDAFSGGRIECPLQAGEYIQYRLYRRGIIIPWTDERPRTPGRWHHILKGIAGVRIGVLPKTGAIMEYVSEDEVGYLAYVEAVLPDNTITVSEVNYPDQGIYSERMLSREAWLSLKPIFIEIT
jgi:hypothetical protein